MILILLFLQQNINLNIKVLFQSFVAAVVNHAFSPHLDLSDAVTRFSNLKFLKPRVELAGTNES